VTGATGSTLLHQLHSDMVAVIILFEDARVADITFEGMQTVAEDNCADALGLYGEFVYHSSDTSHPTHSYSMQYGNRRTNQQQNHY